MIRALILASLALASAGSRTVPLKYSPVWSPDGSHIAWAGGSRIWVASATGANARPVTPTIDALGQLAWLPGGELLYDADTILYRFSLKTHRSTRFGAGRNYVSADQFTTNPARTVVAWGGPPCSLCGGPVAVRRSAGGPTWNAGGRHAQNLSPTLSPDGRRVAFSRNFSSRTGRHFSISGGIWMASVSGGNIRRILRTGTDPVWSPNGRHIAYLDGPSGASHLRLYQLRSGTSQLLTTANAIGPKWAPDSQTIAFLTFPERRLAIVDIANHRVHILGPRADSFEWSPDSTRLLFETRPHDGQCRALRVVSAQGSAPRRLRGC